MLSDTFYIENNTKIKYKSINRFWCYIITACLGAILFGYFQAEMNSIFYLY